MALKTLGLPKFRVIVAFDNHRVGDLIQPTGLMRDRLLRMKFIEPAPPVATMALTTPENELPLVTREPSGRGRKGAR